MITGDNRQDPGWLVLWVTISHQFCFTWLVVGGFRIFLVVDLWMMTGYDCLIDNPNMTKQLKQQPNWLVASVVDLREYGFGMGLA